MHVIIIIHLCVNVKSVRIITASERTASPYALFLEWYIIKNHRTWLDGGFISDRMIALGGSEKKEKKQSNGIFAACYGFTINDIVLSYKSTTVPTRDGRIHFRSKSRLFRAAGTLISYEKFVKDPFVCTVVSVSCIRHAVVFHSNSNRLFLTTLDQRFPRGHVYWTKCKSNASFVHYNKARRCTHITQYRRMSQTTHIQPIRS